jgi:D-xylose transport system ATP-binding protein
LDATKAIDPRPIPATRDAILKVTAVSKSFGAVQALSDVGIEVFPGEVVALVGDNGAGKSTLVKAIAGVNPPDSGTIEWEGEAVRIRKPTDARRIGIATVFQDLALCDNLDLVENLFLGREERRFAILDEIAMEKRSMDLLDELAVTTIQDVRAAVGLLSGGQRQSVAIARSLLGEPKVVILDEPTAALGVAQTAEVLSLVERLRDRGFGVILISHNLPDIFAVADRIVVLRLGKNAGEFKVADTDDQQVVAAITGASDNVVTRRAARREAEAEGGEER